MGTKNLSGSYLLQVMLSLFCYRPRTKGITAPQTDFRQNSGWCIYTYHILLPQNKTDFYNFSLIKLETVCVRFDFFILVAKTCFTNARKLPYFLAILKNFDAL